MQSRTPPMARFSRGELVVVVAVAMAMASTDGIFMMGTLYMRLRMIEEERLGVRGGK